MDLLAHIAPGRNDIRKALRRVVAQIKAQALCGSFDNFADDMFHLE
jgi:hypothetical protein